MNIGPITKKLMVLDPSLSPHNEGYWDEDFIEDTNSFISFNDAGLECETGEFLYSMVRMLKPRDVLETGTHWGVGASYIGLALQDNGYGHLDTIEFLPENHAKACKRILDMKLHEFVTCHFGDVAKFNPIDYRGSNETTETPTKFGYGLILLDTEPQTRFGELLQFYDNLIPGGFVFIHDLHRHMHQIENQEHGFAWPYGLLPEAVKRLVQEDKLRPFHFTTPRGFTGFYKPTAQDYNFKK